MCKYCEGNVDDRPNLISDTCDGCDMLYEVYIGGNRIHASFGSVTIKCCPICERKLNEGD